MVFPSSGTLTFLLLDNEPARCQKGRLVSDKTAVSLREVEERPTARAASLSEEWLGLDSPTGLLAEGQSWYFEVVDCVGSVRAEGPAPGEVDSLVGWRSLSEHERLGRW